MNKKHRLHWFWKLVIVLAMIVGVWYGYVGIRNYYYEKQLADVLDRLHAEDPGWEWDARFAKLPKLMKEENAGEEIKSILRMLTLDEYRASLGTSPWSNDFNKFELDPQAEANRDFLKDHPNARVPAYNRDAMATLLSAAQPLEALERASKLGRFRDGLFNHRYRPFLSMSGLPDVQSVRNLVRLLGFQAMMDLEENRPEKAAERISTMLQAVRVFDHDPFMICTLVRSACVQMACHMSHRLLAQSANISPATLKRLQEEFQREESLMIPLSEGLRWERALHDHDLKLLHTGEYTLSQYLEMHANMFIRPPGVTGWGWLDKVLRKAYPAIVLGFWAEPRHFAVERADLLKHFDRVIQWSNLPEHQLLEGFKSIAGQGPGVSPFIYKMYENGSKEDYPKESYLRIERMARAMLSYRAHCRCIVAALAAERYRQEQGTWPTSWEQLAPRFVAQPLLDPFTGKPLFIKQLPDGLLFYSVGYNLRDDDGTIFPVDKQYYNDIGYRLWNPAERRKDMSKELKAVEEKVKDEGR